MSGSSKRTLRICSCRHCSTTLSTFAVWFAAVATALTSRPVVPDPDLEPEIACKRPQIPGMLRPRDREHAAFATVTAQERGRDRPRRLEVATAPAERRVGVVHDDECAARAADEQLELAEVADVPVGGRAGDRLAAKLGEKRVEGRPASPARARPNVCDQARAAGAVDEIAHPLLRPGAAYRDAPKGTARRAFDRLGEPTGRSPGEVGFGPRQLEAVAGPALRAARHGALVRFGKDRPGTERDEIVVELLPVPRLDARLRQEPRRPERAAKVVLLLCRLSLRARSEHLERHLRPSARTGRAPSR